MSSNPYESSFSDTLKEFMPTILKVVLPIVALVAILFGGWFFFGRSESVKAEALLFRDFNISYGPKDAKLKIYHFFDYQCPSCKAASASFTEIVDKHQDKILFVYKNFPLDTHPFAKPAAYASFAAAKQGKYKEFKEQIYINQDQLSLTKIEEVAKNLGLDMNQFNDYRNGKEVRDYVAKDTADGLAVKLPEFNVEYMSDATSTTPSQTKKFNAQTGVSGTPTTVIIQDTEIKGYWVGSMNLATFDKNVLPFAN